MAFKVLLADDSAAIKKVVQLSLQDFGVDIKSVGSGKDVLDVCRTFKPDIAFVDVLLPQKTGYEVASEIKKDAQLKSTPVVMLWSAFMAFDEAKFKASGAEEKLEKPFEVSTLRNLVTRLVPKLSSNPVAKHLDFPKVEFEQPIGAVPPPRPSAASPSAVSLPPIPSVTMAPQTASLPPIPQAQKSAPMPKEIAIEGPSAPKEEWSMASFEDIGTFTAQMKDLREEAPPSVPRAPLPPAENEEWVRKDVTSRFKVSVPLPDTDENSVAFQYSESEIRDTSFLFKPPTNDQTSVHSSLQEKDKKSENTGTVSKIEIDSQNTGPTKLQIDTLQTDTPRIDTLPKLAATPQYSQLSEADMQKIKQETREAVEKVVWKLVPEIASQIIREELERLLGDEK